MRKIILLFCLSLSAIVAFSQLSVTGKNSLLGKKDGKDSITLIIFDSITSNTYINYSGTNVRFYKFDDAVSKTNPIYPTLYPEDATGYVIDVDGIRKDTIWIISYKNYKLKADAISINSIQPNSCNLVNLNFNVPQLFYKNISGSTFTMNRDFTIKYQTLKWDETTNKLSKVYVTQTIITPATQRSVDVPYCDTRFTLIGDQYASSLDSISSEKYVTSAVICHLTTNVTSRQRDKNNEGSAPSDVSPINFSAPIDVQFLSNANDSTTQFYKWGIYKDNALIINRTDKDHRYTFTEAGTYKVKLTVSNSTCSFSDSLTIVVSESAIYVPNVFTPNGDNVNDEFRIGYKSLISFQCWVYNRWGRQVYYWSDPTKGWDGNINGKKAVPGPYFYVIKAIGSDKKVYKMKGDINLLRGTGNQ